MVLSRPEPEVQPAPRDRVELTEAPPARHEARPTAYTTSVASDLGVARDENRAEVSRRDVAHDADAHEIARSARAEDASGDVSPPPQKPDEFDWHRSLYDTQQDPSQLLQWMSSPAHSQQQQEMLDEASRDPGLASAITAMQARASQTESGRTALSGFLGSVSHDPDHAAALLKSQTLAAGDPAGRDALGQLMGTAAHDPALGSSLLGVDSAAAQTTGGRLALEDRLKAVSSDPRLSALQLSITANAVRTPAGQAFLEAVSSDPLTASAFTRMEAAALQTPEGRRAEQGLLDAAASDPRSAALLQGIHAAAASSTEGRESLTGVYHAYGADPGLTAAAARLDHASLQTEEGAHAYAGLHRAASASPELSTAMLRYETTALASSQTHVMMAGALELASARTDCATARASVQASAASTADGLQALGDHLGQVGRDPALSAAQVRADAKAASTAEGAGLLAERNRALAQDPRAAAALVGVQQTAATTEQGRADLATYYERSAREPALASSNVGVEAAAAHDTAGARDLQRLYGAMGRDDRLSLAHTQSENTALQTSSGREATLRLCSAEASNPVLATAHESSHANVVAQAENGSVAARTATADRQAQGSRPDLAAATVARDAALLQTPAGSAQVEQRLRHVAANPALAAREMERSAHAASDPSALQACHRGLAHSPSASAQHAWVMVAAARTPEGRAALESPPGHASMRSFLNAAAARPPSAASTLRVVAGDARLTALVGASPDASRGVLALMQSTSATPAGRALVTELRGQAGMDRVVTAASTHETAEAAPIVAVSPQGRDAAVQVRAMALLAATPDGATQLADSLRATARVPDAAHETVRVFDLALESTDGRAAYGALLERAAETPRLGSSLEGLQQSAQRSLGGTDTVREHVARVWDDPDLSGAYQELHKDGLAATPPAPAGTFGGLSAAAASRLAAQALHVRPAEEQAGTVDTGVDPFGWAEAPTVLDGPGGLDGPPSAAQASVAGRASEGRGPQQRPRAAEREEEETEGVGTARGVAPTQAPHRTGHLDPIQAVSLFDTADAQGRTCTRCGSPSESRAPGCPSCSSERRELLISSMSTIQRAGYVIGRQTDRVEITAGARDAMADGGDFASMRKAPQFVQYRDMLALHSPRATGYAVVQGGR